MALAWGLACAGGAERGAAASAASLAFAPALAGFALLPWLSSRLGSAGLLAVWLLTATGLVAGAGGAATPLVAAFAIIPALALGLGRPWVAQAGALAALGYAGAAALALLVRPPEANALGAMPEMLAAASVAFAAGLLAMAPSSAARELDAGRRIAEVSHELRTPLTHILGFSEMIERQVFGPASERYAEYAGLIRRSGAHLLELVNDLLDLSKIDAGRYDLELEAFDARDLVAEVVRMSADAATRKSIALGLVTPDAALNVRADARALRRILLNTLGNALKFTPDGGRVIVVARVEENTLILETMDSGPGIPAAERERLGQAYERGASGARVEGAGLGLSLVRALAALHGGHLSFHDAPQGGALVRVTLPVLV